MTGQVLALARYTLLARLIGPEQLGLAALLILTSQFLESVSDTGSDRFLVQDRDGDAPQMLNLVHLAMGLRGITIAALLVLLAGPLAGLFQAPSLQDSLVWLAITPLLAGLLHYDIRRVQRAGDFRPEGVTIIAGETAALIGTGVAAWILRDHTAVIYGLALRAMAMVIASHIMAHRPYRWGFSRPEAGRFGAFAAPLFLNGLLLFMGSQGDRLLIGSTVGPTALGYYSAILLLIMSPLAAMSRFLMTVHLPSLSAQRDEPAQFDAATGRLAGRATLAALAAGLGFTLLGPVATYLLYGREFVQPLLIFALLGVLQSLRFVRFWPNTVAVSIGRSSVVTVNNIARLAGLFVALAAVVLGWGLEGIVAGFILGEVAALLAALVQLNQIKAIPLRRDLERVGLLLAMFVVAIAWGEAIDFTISWTTPILAFITAFGLVTIVRRERVVIGEAVSLVMRRLRRPR